MVWLVITPVSHTRGLRFDSVFRQHSFACLKDQNSCHKSLTSMNNKCVNVWMGELVITLPSEYIVVWMQELIIKLPSETNVFWLKSAFTYNNCAGLSYN